MKIKKNHIVDNTVDNLCYITCAILDFRVGKICWVSGDFISAVRGSS